MSRGNPAARYRCCRVSRTEGSGVCVISIRRRIGGRHGVGASRRERVCQCSGTGRGNRRVRVEARGSSSNYVCRAQRGTASRERHGASKSASAALGAIVAVSVTAVVVVTLEVGLAPTVVVVGAAVMLPALKLLERPNRARNCWTSETFGLESWTMAIVTPVPGEFPGTADNCSGDLLFSSGKNFPKWDEGRVRKDPSLRSASHNIPRMRQLMLKLTVAFAVALPDVPVMPTVVEPVMAMSNVPLCEGLV